MEVNKQFHFFKII